MPAQADNLLTSLPAQRGPLVTTRFVAMARRRSLPPQAVLLSLALLLGASQALSAWSLSDVAARLRHASDDRIRVQAALALGASMSPEAISPLCEGLRDPSASVRGAAAAGLGRLRRPQALVCLERGETTEDNHLVLAEVRRSIARIRSTNGRTAANAAQPARPTDQRGTAGEQ